MKKIFATLALVLGMAVAQPVLARTDPVMEFGDAYNLTATGDVGTAGQDMVLIGFYVNSTTSGTLVLKRGGSAGTAISGTITPAIGFHAFPAAIPGGLHATIAGTALNVTFFVVPNQALGH